ncbi:MAG: hypothetical protein GVY08_04275 [Bacteroidetes bacterium]|jgi:hypothetical protein|nr:hypothetical protein [Bacteroidota bacterium]
MSEKVTFKELVEKISQSTNENEQSVNSFLSELVDIIETKLREGDSVKIDEFGKFEVQPRDSGPGRVLNFSPYKKLRERINHPAQLRMVRRTSDPDATSGEESVEDLLIERPKPLADYISLKKSADAQTGRAASEPTDDEQMPVGMSETERSDRDDFTFHWSPFAVSVLAVLVLFLLFYLAIYKGGIDESDLQGSNESEPPELTQVEQSSGMEITMDTLHESTAANSQESDTATSNTTPADTEEQDRNVYTIRRNDTLWDISINEYGDGYLWPLIFHNNRSVIGNPTLIPAGMLIYLPPLGDPNNLTDTERREVARGYFYVYDWMKENQPQNARFYLWAMGSYSQEELQRVSDSVDPSDLAFATQR